jgi:IclR family acetate operon transcriptional repressor
MTRTRTRPEPDAEPIPAGAGLGVTLEHGAAHAEAGASVRAVERALQLVEVFARSRGPLAITDLARTLELAPSTVHRLVQTLTALGYVVQYPESKRYGPGRGIAEISRSMLLKHEYTQYAQPHLDALAAETGETANLAVLFGTGVVVLKEAASRNAVRVAYGVGTIAPLHCTASGKVFLADFDAHALAGVVEHAGLEALTPRSLTTLEALERDLGLVRERRNAVEDEERDLGARGVSVGLRGSSGTVVAAIGLSGPVSRVTPDRVPELARLVSETAERLARQLRRP